MDKFDVLKNYKELLDNEIITQEEFNTKKKEILESPELSYKLDSIVKGAKDMTDDIKEKTGKRLEELRLKQAEEAGTRKGAKSVFETFNQASGSVKSETSSENINDMDPNDEIHIDVAATPAFNPTPPKKKIYKQKWFWIAIAVLLLFCIVGGNSSDDNNTTDESINTAVEEQAQDAQEEAQEELQEEAISSDESSDSNNSYISDDVVVATLNNSYKEQGTWEIASDRHFAFYPKGDLADAFTVVSTYYAQYGEIPAEVQDSFDYMCNSIKDLSEVLSETVGEPCALSIVNPSNTNNVLITYMNGTTLYSAFEG